MFDPSEAGDRPLTAGLVATSYRTMVEHETRLLELAAHWADLHADPGHDARTALRLVGGVGTPEVWEHAAAELGALQETTTQSAVAQMADALDLRHRLPRLWSKVRSGSVRAWKARAVAKATRHLSVTAAGYVDQAVADAIITQAWGPFTDYLDAKIYEADPKAADYEHAVKAADRYVSTGRSNKHGLKTLIARANAGDVIWFLAMTNRIAGILAAEGDSDTADVRRSKAIGILAQPAVALDLLTRHLNDEDDPAEPSEPADPEPTHDEAGAHTSVRFDPFDPRVRSLDPAQLRPPVTLYLHLSAEALLAGHGVVRMEDVGPVLLGRLRTLLGEQAQIRLQPVIDPADTTPVNAYEIPTLMRERVRLRNPIDVFPWATTAARSCDLDHTQPYLDPAHGGPPGQTQPAKLGPLNRSHHRTKTFTRWSVRQVEAGVFVWRSPNGWIYLVNHQGTHPLGNTPFAHAVWHAAQRQDAFAVAS